MSTTNQDSLETRGTLQVHDQEYEFYSLKVAEKKLGDLSHLPMSLKVLLENLLRYEDGKSVTLNDIKALANWDHKKSSEHEIAFRPARVLMQDFTGVPGVVDLAAMRDAIEELGGDPSRINPLSPVDLVIDHSVQVDNFGTPLAYVENVQLEMERNKERYVFLRWGQKAFDNFQLVPPGTGICHQVNLEYLAKTVWSKEVDGRTQAFPDTLVGTDSHTTMINGLGVLGWGVGGIEAEAAMLGQPISMLIPDVIGFKLEGKLSEGITATDLVLTITQMLRKRGVVGKFVEFFGPGLQHLPLADRATIANMAPEYGATCGFFPIDKETITYLHLSGRDEQTIKLVEAYAKAQGLWHEPNITAEPHFTDVLQLDLASVEPSLAGPKRPQDRVSMANIPQAFVKVLEDANRVGEKDKAFSVANESYDLHHGDIVIAAITSCTNTSNPSVMMAAGLVAKKAIEKGLVRKPWVKSSLAPGSKVVTEYLEKAGLQTYLNQLGFNLVGYGCTTCIGNSGPLDEPIAKTVASNDLIVSAVLSGNRNFEGRVHPQVKANWLASPPLVVAYALAGSTLVDLTKDALGEDAAGNAIYLKDIWPSNVEVAAAVRNVEGAMFRKEYAEVFAGDAEWNALAVPEGATFAWDADSTYIQRPPFFSNLSRTPQPLSEIKGARILAVFADSITTDHISPASSIKVDSPAGKYLISKGVEPKDFNSYGARRGNYEVMARGTFANIRIRNEMVPGVEGGFTKHYPSDETLSIYDAAMRYQQAKIPLIVIAGKEYGTGSSRDWAAKGPKLLGIHAVIAESFERIHRSNLVGMGILPLEFVAGEDRKSLGLTGTEIIDITGIMTVQPRMQAQAVIHYNDGSQKKITLLCRIDTEDEAEYYRHGGSLQYVLRTMLH
ncbi:aconitate hydratase AcnA [soil metagenome]